MVLPMSKNPVTRRPAFHLLYRALFIACLIGVSAQNARADEGEFYAWLSNFRTEAYKQGISPESINDHFAAIEYVPDVITKDRNQPEFKLSFKDYKQKIVSAERIATGKKSLRANEKYLNWVEQKSGVPKSIVVALWGIETRFGQVTGGYDILSALATLSYDGRRREYFTKEFITTLKLMDKHPYLTKPFMGSWAGAMGQCQFMPSTYWNFAIDGNNNGRVDLWNEREDVFASAANYLMKSGWKKGEPWGTPVKLSKPVDIELATLNVQKTVAEWGKMGVKTSAGGAMPNSGAKASLIMPDGKDGPAFLVYRNYRTIMAWNRSHHFAISVGMLSDRIGGVQKHAEQQPDKPLSSAVSDDIL